MLIAIDSREKERAITMIVDFFNKNDIQYFTNKLPVGDYINWASPAVSVDRKQSLGEVYNNLCQDRARLRTEMERARDMGTKLVFLVEHGGKVKTLEDVKDWKNPRLEFSPYAWDGKRLYKTMCTVAEKYGVEWQFCDKRQTGRRILEILEAGRHDRL